jgi:hypothetical protein
VRVDHAPDRPGVAPPLRKPPRPDPRCPTAARTPHQTGAARYCPCVLAMPRSTAEIR